MSLWQQTGGVRSDGVLQAHRHPRVTTTAQHDSPPLVGFYTSSGAALTTLADGALSPWSGVWLIGLSQPVCVFCLGYNKL